MSANKNQNMKEEIELQVKEPLLGLIQSCETYCVAYCCGLDAFDRSQEQVAMWIGAHPREETLLALAQLNELIARVKPDSDVLFWNWFSHGTPAGEALEWLNGWKVSLEANLNLDQAQ
jgi:Family of unknown function (DUF6331)